MKKMFLSASFFALFQIESMPNGWSFAPPPRQTESEKTNQQSRLQIPPHRLTEVGDARGDIFAEDEEARFNRFVVARSLEAFRIRLEHPMRTVEHLFGESAGERMGDAFADDGENLVASVLRFTARERFVTPLHIGHTLKDAIGPRQEEKSLDTFHALAVPRMRAGFHPLIRPFREDPYLGGEYGLRNGAGLVVWELSGKLFYEAFDIERGLTGTWERFRTECLVSRNLPRGYSLGAGVAYRSHPDRNGSTFERGEDQWLSVFLGVGKMLKPIAWWKRGELSFRASGPDTVRFGAVCLLEW